MFHSFDYPDETGGNKLGASFWRPRMVDGVLRFPRPEECTVKREIRELKPKRFDLDRNLRDVEREAKQLEA
jgi:CRISPR-associated protein Cas5d